MLPAIFNTVLTTSGDDPLKYATIYSHIVAWSNSGNSEDVGSVESSSAVP